MAESTGKFPAYIGKYKISGIVAKGGMGVVYKAVHPSLKRYVVIKKMTSRRNSSNVERFKREAQILLDLQSPYIVHLFDYFTEGGYRYMVEELVDGMALDKLLQKQVALSPEMSLLILQDACNALKYSHAKDIVHRDIKPGNILISKKAEIKLADFGIASDGEASSDETSPSLTQTGVALGTPAYMPPEQFEDSANVDKRADIYALGVMLYEMVTGTKPYPGTLSLETLNVIKKGKYIPPKKIDKNIPNVICRLIGKMLRPKAKRRYPSTAPILKEIKRYLRHYDTKAIRVQLAKLVLSDKKVEESAYIPKDMKVRMIRKIVLFALLTLMIFVSAWHFGFVQRYILRHWLTPIGIELTMPSSASVGSDLPVMAFFFENKDDIPEVKGTRRVLKIDGNLSGKHKLFKARTVFLAPGKYRVKIVAGPYVWWKSFDVTEKEETIGGDFLKNMRRPIKIHPNVLDSSTGRDITSFANLTVFYNNSWVKIEEVPQEKMLSGTVWKYKFHADGYEDEIFSLRFDWYQDELFLTARLNPKS